MSDCEKCGNTQEISIGRNPIFGERFRSCECSIATKIQVDLPPKIPLRWASDYPNREDRRGKELDLRIVEVLKEELRAWKKESKLPFSKKLFYKGAKRALKLAIQKASATSSESTKEST